MALVILAALPATLACAGDRSPLLDAAELIEHSRRSARGEPSCSRHSGGLDGSSARRTAPTKPACLAWRAPARSAVESFGLAVHAPVWLEAPGFDEGLRSAVRAGFGAAPPPAC